MCGAFAVAYGVGAFLSGNQNSYLLHAVAGTGEATLRYDWTAATRDPFPVFTALVTPLVTLWPTVTFSVGHLALIALYACGLLGIVERTFTNQRSERASLATFLVLVALHSRLLASASMRMAHVDVRALLQDGVASQYLLGPGLQPSVFGVFLILSLYAYLAGHPALAAICAAVAATVHGTYMLSAAILTLAYTVPMWWTDRRSGRAVALASVSLLLVLPALVSSIRAFGPTDAETFRRAAAILVHTRLPLHADPAFWFGAATVVKLVLIVIALVLVRHRPVFQLLLPAFVAGVILTAMQVLTSSDTLALMFPWRMSTWLVPISTALIVGRAVCGLALRDRASIACLALLALFGAAGSVHEGMEAANRPEAAMMTFVAHARRPGDVYLVPPELADFRLRTQAPIVVDAKTHPYKDVEVIEWDQRLREVRAFYAASDVARCGGLAALVDRYHATRVVMPAATELRCSATRQIYRDRAFAVYVHLTK